MSKAVIRAAFESRLAAWAAAQTPKLLIAYENMAFAPPAGTYLRAYLLPAATGSETLDGLHRAYRGVFQVSIAMPLNGGPGASKTIEEALDALYPITFEHAGLRIYRLSPMSAATGIPEPDRYVVPVSCRYRADTI